MCLDKYLLVKLVNEIIDENYENDGLGVEPQVVVINGRGLDVVDPVDICVND